MLPGAKCGVDRIIAGRAIAGRPIIAPPRAAAEATVPGKLSAATQIKNNMWFVFIHYCFLLIQPGEGDLSCYDNNWKK